MMKNLKISILDFGLREGNANSMVRLQDLFDYVSLADELGFSRFWIAEHYFNNTKMAWSSPIVLLPILANITTRIKIGTGGVLLKVHSVYEIASSFKMLNNIFRGRIDLGLVNGGAFNEQILKLSSSDTDSFDDKYKALISLLQNEKEYLEKEVVVPPYAGDIPEIWSMSSTIRGYDRALRLGTNFVRSVFHKDADLSPEKDKLYQFKEDFLARHGFLPKVILGISGCCQPTEQKALAIFNSLTLDSSLHIVGSFNQFQDRVLRLADEFDVDEVIFKDIAKNRSDRMLTLELISALIGSKNPHVYS
jgi:luciferase family oxidoreductase group 1